MLAKKVLVVFIFLYSQSLWALPTPWEFCGRIYRGIGLYFDGYSSDEVKAAFAGRYLERPWYAEAVPMDDAAGSLMRTATVGARPVTPKGAAAPLPDSIHQAYSRISENVEQAANRVTRGAGDDSSVNFNAFMKDSVDGVIDDFTNSSQTATRSEANEMSRKLDWFKKGSLTPEQSRRIRNLQIALDDYDAGRTNSVLIDPTSVKDNPLDVLGLSDSNAALQNSTIETFIEEAQKQLDQLPPAEKLMALKDIARYGWKREFKVSKRLEERLVNNNEWSLFSGNVSAFAVDELVKIGTPDALAVVALEVSANVRITSDQFVVLSEKVIDIMTTKTPPALAREAIKLAKKALQNPPYSFSESYRIAQAKQDLDQLEKAITRN